MLSEPEEQLFTRSRSVVSRVVAGETLIVPVRGRVGDLASIYSFNATGSLIWRLLDVRPGVAAAENDIAAKELTAAESNRQVMLQPAGSH